MSGDGRSRSCPDVQALFQPGGLANLDVAYDRYVEFEELRHELSRPDGVMAYEVAPGDRLGAVLSAGRGRRRHGAMA